MYRVLQLRFSDSKVLYINSCAARAQFVRTATTARRRKRRRRLQVARRTAIDLCRALKGGAMFTPCVQRCDADSVAFAQGNVWSTAGQILLASSQQTVCCTVRAYACTKSYIAVWQKRYLAHSKPARHYLLILRNLWYAPFVGATELRSLNTNKHSYACVRGWPWNSALSRMQRSWPSDHKGAPMHRVTAYLRITTRLDATIVPFNCSLVELAGPFMLAWPAASFAAVW